MKKNDTTSLYIYSSCYRMRRNKKGDKVERSEKKNDQVKTRKTRRPNFVKNFSESSTYKGPLDEIEEVWEGPGLVAILSMIRCSYNAIYIYIWSCSACFDLGTNISNVLYKCHSFWYFFMIYDIIKSLLVENIYNWSSNDSVFYY